MAGDHVSNALVKVADVGYPVEDDRNWQADLCRRKSVLVSDVVKGAADTMKVTGKEVGPAQSAWLDTWG